MKQVVNVPTSLTSCFKYAYVVVWYVYTSPASHYRLGQHHTGCVNCLVDALQVDPPGDLSDQNWGHPFGTQFLMNTEEVHLHHLLLPRIHKFSTTAF